MHSYKVLNIYPANHRLQKIFSKELNISRVLAQILVNRGIESCEDAEKFLNANLEHLLDPYKFYEMPKALGLVKKALQKKERVLVFGDYDVDGITSIALLKNTLTYLGLEVMPYLPHRLKEGYGLNKNAVSLAKEKKIKLLISADCGINSQEVIKELKRNGVSVIITDHHQPLSGRPKEADCVINPKLKDARYPFRDLAGVGVTYKFCQAVTRRNLFEDLDLVSLGTIADVVPLQGENRIIAKEGLKILNATKREGLRALIQSSRIEGRAINATIVSYILAPRLNASGRMENAETSLKLLLSDRETEAQDLVKTLEAQNRQRQKIEEKILEEAVALIGKEVNFKKQKIIVVAKEDWHPGVLGIVASKIAERFYRPAILISLIGKDCRGSGRSIKNFHLFEALVECKNLLKNFGGHAQAAGFVVNRENLVDFKQNIERVATERLKLEDLFLSLEVDLEIALADLNADLIQELEVLEPFGPGNLEPIFFTPNLKLKASPQVLGRNTLKFWVSDGDFTYAAIGFGMGGICDSLSRAGSFDLVYTPRIDSFKNEETILLESRDIFLR